MADTISVQVANPYDFDHGISKGEWIELPVDDRDLDGFLDDHGLLGRDTIIVDAKVDGLPLQLRWTPLEEEDVRDVNLLAQTLQIQETLRPDSIGVIAEAREELEADGPLAIANIALQTEDIRNGITPETERYEPDEIRAVNEQLLLMNGLYDRMPWWRIDTDLHYFDTDIARLVRPLDPDEADRPTPAREAIEGRPEVLLEQTRLPIGIYAIEVNELDDGSIAIDAAPADGGEPTTLATMQGIDDLGIPDMIALAAAAHGYRFDPSDGEHPVIVPDLAREGVLDPASALGGLPIANPSMIQTEFEERTRRFIQGGDDSLAAAYDPATGTALRVDVVNQGRFLDASAFRFDQERDMPHVASTGDIVALRPSIDGGDWEPGIASRVQRAIVDYGGDPEVAADRIMDIIASELGTTSDNVGVIEGRIRDLTATLNTAPDPWIGIETYTPAPTQATATPTTTGPQPSIS